MRWPMYERSPEEDLFSRTPEGWILTIGGKWSYLVDDAQKAELLARLDRWRFIWVMLLVTVLAVLFLLSKGLLRSAYPDWVDFSVGAAILILVAVIFFRFALPHIQFFILRPVLTDARPAARAQTPVRAGFWDSLSVDIRRQAEIWSFRGLTLVCVVFVWFSIRSGYAAFTSKGTYIETMGNVLLTAYFGVVLFVKLKAPRSHD
jgi:hypothetical protein